MTDKELIKQEIIKCSSDYTYCLKKYGKIVIPGKSKVPFELWDFQQKTLDLFQANKNIIILKGRQLGLSTLVAGFIACELIFKEHYQALTIATKMGTAINIIRKVKTFIGGFPPWMKTALNANPITDNAQSVELSNGSFAKSEGRSEDVGRSEGLSLLVCDEAAFIRNMDDIWAGASETLSTTGGKTIILSTPCGVGNWFHKMYTDAEEGKTGFLFLKIPWYMHPDRDLKWKDERLRALKYDIRKFAQEHDCSFESSGKTIIPGTKIKEISDKTRDPLEVIGSEKNMWVWKWPQEKHTYIVSADSATAGGEDYSAFHVLDLETCEQVAEYQGHISPADFGDMLVSIASRYNEALLVIENNSLGIATIQPAIDKEYKNLLWTLKGGLEYIDPIKNPYMMDNRTTTPGFATTRKTRPLMIQKLEDYLGDDSLIIHSKRFVNELWTFVYEGGKAQAMGSYHDDLIMAMCIALWTRDTVLKLKSINDSFDKRRNDWMFQQQYSSSEALYTNTKLFNDPYKINTGWFDEDIRWLIEK